MRAALLLLATATADFSFKDPFFNINDLTGSQPTNNAPQSFDLSNLVPQLFAPTSDQKPFVPQLVVTDPADNAVSGQDGGGGGSWEILSHNAGVSAMHLIIRPNNKAIMLDTFVYGPSAIKLAPGNCRRVLNQSDDCWVHAVEFDINTAETRPLKNGTLAAVKISSDFW